MKMILMLLTAGCLLASTGCVIDHSHDRDHRVHNDGAMGGIDHGEHPGDLEHGDTMQK